MNIILFNDVSLFIKNKTIIYGQYDLHFNNIKIAPEIEHKIIFCEKKKDFYIEIPYKIFLIEEIIFGDKISFKNVKLFFPLEKCDLQLNPDSNIISTFCKDYSSRLEEWILYNLKLGFSGIIIFDNDKNKKNKINESLENRQDNGNIKNICEKYKNKVFRVEFNYEPIQGNHYDTIQRISLHIGVNAFVGKCAKIALIDADEFIHIPNNYNINHFLSHYRGKTITIRSNILTNKKTDDLIDNNILDLCLYVGEDKYTKTILDTSNIDRMEFIVTPHKHPTQIILEKDKIIHYHCWVNSRYIYKETMEKIEFLKGMKYSL
jgi:hypothetical protein